MKQQPLKEISFRIPIDAEEAVFALVQERIGHCPTIYTDFETGETRAFVYIEASRWRPKLLVSIKADMARLIEYGWHVPEQSFSTRSLKHQDWAEVWKRHFPPLEIAERLLIKPSWSKQKPKPNELTIILDPGLSFGTGHHATTSFCLEQLVALRKESLPQSLLDAGTGSGILAIAAAKLGFNPVQAFDFDPQCVIVSNENIRVNKLTDELNVTRKDLTQLPLESRIRFDVICANLLADLLIQEVDRLRHRLKPEGTLIAAGILQTQFASVRKKFEKSGLKLTATAIEKEWQSGTFRLK